MAMAGIAQILDNASSLQAAGGAHRQNTLRIACPARALCAEAALAPQDSLSHQPFGQIVRRLHPRVMHEGPQILPLVEDAAAFGVERSAN